MLRRKVLRIILFFQKPYLAFGLAKLKPWKGLVLYMHWGTLLNLSLMLILRKQTLRRLRISATLLHFFLHTREEFLHIIKFSYGHRRQESRKTVFKRSEERRVGKECRSRWS